MELSRIKDKARKAVLEAGSRLRDFYYRTSLKVSYKGAIDLVTEADFNVEAFLLEELETKTGLKCIAEETRGIEPVAGSYWLIDPLDGTVNFVHRYPAFCISLALVDGGEIVLGFVYDPLRDELFEAEKGKGAFLNGVKIKVSETDSLSRSLLATGFPYDVWLSRNNLREFGAFLLKAQGIRRSGSAALDLCYVACGRLDGFWEPGLKPWDMAAGALIVWEAGGAVSDYEGGQFNPFKPFIVASNSLIHDQMLEVLASVRQ